MSSRALKVLVVANDRSLLRRLSRFLSQFGYEPHSAASVELGLKAIQADRPDFLLLDAQCLTAQAAELYQLAKAPGRQPFVPILLLVDQTRDSSLLEAVEAGVDDFLKKPVVYGEVLARLRAAARDMEFERRLGEQSGADSLTGCSNQAVFRERVERELACNQQVTLVALEVDFLAQVNLRQGELAAAGLLREVADQLRQTAPRPALLAHAGEGRFNALFLNDAGDAGDWANAVRAQFAASALEAGQESPRVTLSGGIVHSGDQRPGPRELWRRLQQTLNAAKSSGCDCVVVEGEFKEEDDQWKELAEPGRLFEATTAADVMTPNLVALRREDSIKHAQAVFLRTHMTAIPVISDTGKLAGLLWGKHLLDQDGGTVGDLTCDDTVSLPEDTPFTRLMEVFIREGKSFVVITRDDRPVGYLTRVGLATLIEPLNADSFQNQDDFSTGTDYLLIDDVRIVETR